MRPLLLLSLALAYPAQPATAQSLGERMDRARSGTVRFSFPARPDVCGDGRHNISIRRHDRDEWSSDCETGPVRVAVDRKDGRTVAVRTYVGGRWGSGQAVDLGTVPAAEAANWLLELAERDEPAGHDAIFPATLGEGVEPWPTLLRIARKQEVSRKTRRAAVFWLGQAAGEAATAGLDSIVSDPQGDREVREAAVFALSQQPRGLGVPALIRVARSNRDPELRKKALFWLGQSEDPAALALFEELLTRR